jgi:hypothetical protein
MFCVAKVVGIHVLYCDCGTPGGEFESADLEAAISNSNLKTPHAPIKSNELNIDVKLTCCYVNVRLSVLSRLRSHEVSSRETFRCTCVLKICNAFSFGIVQFERHGHKEAHFTLKAYNSTLGEPR